MISLTYQTYQTSIDIYGITIKQLLEDSIIFEKTKSPSLWRYRNWCNAWNMPLNRSFFVNGKSVDEDYLLEDKDELIVVRNKAIVNSQESQNKPFFVKIWHGILDYMNGF